MVNGTFIKIALGIIMAAITIQQVEQNLAAMPEEQRAVAEEAMNMLSDDQLQSVLDVFDIQLSMEEAPQPEEVPMEEPMAEDELPTLPMPEEEAPGIVGYISSKYSEAKASRQTHEARWLRAYKNYR